MAGALVGLLGCLLTYLALLGCEAVRGTSTCGGAGLPLLVLVLAAMVLAGAGLTSVWRVPDATSTSVLAVGLVAVVVMLFLLDEVDSPWMFLWVPVLGAGAFAAAQAVTARSGDAGDLTS